MTAHWDIKFKTNITGTEHVDRVPVIATCGPFEQLIGIPSITLGSEQYQADSIQKF